MGLRELKKQRTRKAISDMATQLFLERGYYNVTTAEIAELAEVSVPTLFKYFPSKESLVFDEDSEMENWLIEVVLRRKKSQSILDALLEAGTKKIDETPKEHKDNFKVFMNFIEKTPELNLYAKYMWMRHEQALAEVIRKEAKNKISKIETEVIARFVLDAFHRSIGAPNSKAVLRAMFKILRDGWTE
jgi:AcrR family transcriptional regulator